MASQARLPTPADLRRLALPVSLGGVFWCLGMLLYLFNLAYMEYMPGTFERLTVPVLLAITAGFLSYYCNKEIEK
jgi:hypothetical protein